MMGNAIVLEKSYSHGLLILLKVRDLNKGIAFLFRELGKDGVLAIIMLILVVVLAAIIIIFCAKAIADTISGGSTTAGSTTVNTAGSTTEPVKTDPVYTTPVAGAWNEGYITTDRLNAAVHEGDLIVVNNDHAYTFPSSINLVEMWGKPGFGTNYTLGNGMTYPDGKVKSVTVKSKTATDIIETDNVVLAIGHSARDTVKNGFSPSSA